VGTATAFDISTILSDEDNVLGQLLRALFGYSSAPEWATLVIWLGYVVTVLALYLRPMQPPAPRPLSETRPAAGGQA
jgi:high-affinity Fe2+/Pb2+ permease